jgi:hypothetical protein
MAHPVLALSSVLLIGAVLQGTPIQRLAWFQGCWRMSAPGRVIEETWTAPAGRSMLGISRTVRGDSLVEYEFVVLREDSGTVTYQARPSGQAGAVFKASLLTDSAVVFENPAHDFPQRIGYRRAGPDSLVAWIEGTLRGNLRRREFPYARVACPG